MRSSAFSGDTKEKKIKISKPRKAKMPAQVVAKMPKMGAQLKMAKPSGGKKKLFGM